MWSKVDGLLRRLSGVPVVGKLVPQGLRRKLQPVVEAEFTRRLPDRRYMETQILPAVRDRKPTRVLFVGAERYTKHYSKWFSACEYWTLDIRPEVAVYGAKGKHVIASVLEADRHFEGGYFDVVFLNGVFGWGVDTVEDQNTTLRVLRGLMKPDGLLILGWNDHRVKEPKDLVEMSSGFVHGAGDGLPDRKSFEGSTHVYDFFVVRS